MKGGSPNFKSEHPFKIQRSFLKYEDQDTCTEDFDSKEVIGGYSSANKSVIKIEDYITNKSVILHSQERNGEEEREQIGLDLK